MRGETPGHPERPDNNEEEVTEGREEGRFERFAAAHEDARAIVGALRELDPELFPEAIQTRLDDALEVLEEAGRASFGSTLPEARRREIEQRARDKTSETSGPLADFRLSMIRERERTRLERELTLLQSVWSEALERLPSPSDRNMTEITIEKKSAAELEDYLADRQRDLSPEEIFFLQTSIEIRKVKTRLYGQPSEKRKAR
jgi:hypothetical protein